MRLLRYYRKFADLSEAELREETEERRAQRRSQALERKPALDLASTSWPEPCHSEVITGAVYQMCRRLDVYPSRECHRLRELIASRHAIEPTRIAVGNGASELIQQAALVLLGPDCEAVMPWPGPALFALAAKRASAQAVPVYSASIEAIRSAITERTRVVFICNPNDPTGQLVPAATIEGLLESLPERVHLLVDEAYVDFQDAEDRDRLLKLAAQRPRLVVFRSFSKIYGLAGLRCGFVVAAEGSARLLDALCPAYGVNSLTQAAIERALSDSSLAELERRREAVIAARRRVFDGLGAVAVDAPQSQANFLWLAASGRSAPTLARALEREGILVYSGQNLGDEAHVRATVRNQETADRLLRALERICS